jgi:hypothetical protein
MAVGGLVFQTNMKASFLSASETVASRVVSRAVQVDPFQER